MNKRTKIALIREFFGIIGSDAIREFREFKQLTDVDKQQLGSGIARSMGLGVDGVDFEMVAY